MIKTFEEKDCLFLFIDIQEKLLKAVYNPETIQNKSIILAKAAKTLQIPAVVSEQYPKGLGPTIEPLKECLNANFFEKVSFSALDSEKILDELKKSKRKQIIISGIEAHICVYQTVNALLQNDFCVTVVKDAISSRSKDEYDGALENFKRLGVQLKTTEMILFELIKSSKHEKFKEIQGLIK